MRALFAVPLAAFSSWGWAQQLVAVAPPSDSSGLFVLAILAIVGGLVFLKVKHPETFDKILARGKKVAGTVEREFEEIRDKAKKIPTLTDVVKVEPRVPAFAPTSAPAAILTPQEVLAYLRAHYPELIATPPPPPPPPPTIASQPSATPAGSKIVNGQLMA